MSQYYKLMQDTRPPLKKLPTSNLKTCIYEQPTVDKNMLLFIKLFEKFLNNQLQTIVIVVKVYIITALNLLSNLVIGFYQQYKIYNKSKHQSFRTKFPLSWSDNHCFKQLRPAKNLFLILQYKLTQVRQLGNLG